MSITFTTATSSLLNLSYHNVKAFATEFADRNICILGENRHRVGSDAHLTSENGKLAALTSGRPAFQQHEEHAEGSDTSHVSHTRKALSTECENRNFDRNEKRSRSPAGPRRLGTATRISASLSRRLSASFWRTPGQDPKAAQFAVLPPGHAGFPKRVKQSEGSDTTPIRNAPCFAL